MVVPSDLTLWEHWRDRREAAAFDEIVSRHAGTVYATCRRILRNPADAEDVAQECFLRLAAADADLGTSLVGWLHRVARNLSLNLLRTESRRRRREVRAAEDRGREAGPTWNGIEGLVDEAIERLPDDLRAAIIGHFLERETYDSLADRMGLSRRMVEYRIGKGIEAIRLFLRRHGVSIGGPALASLFASNLTEAAPPGLLITLGKLAIAGTPGSAATMVGAAKSAALIEGLLMKKAIAVAVLLLVLVPGTWWLLRPGERAPAPAIIGKEKVAISLPAATPAPPPRAETERTGQPAPDSTVRSAGTFSVEGFVYDAETGEPIAGAQIEGGDLKTRTDDDGAFQIDAVPSRTDSLLVSAEGYARREALIQLTGDAFGVEIWLDPAFEALVEVVDREGSPIEGAHVWGNTRDEGQTTTEIGITDASGTLRVAGLSRLRPLRLQAEKKGFRAFDPIPFDAIWIDGQEGGLGKATIVLEPVPDLSRAIEGLVSDLRGNPLAGINVQWTQAESGEKGKETVQSGQDGRYRLEFEFAGEREDCSLSVFGQGWAPQAIDGVKTGSPERPAVHDFQLEPGHKLEGKVVDEEGKPVPKASVWAGPTGHNDAWRFPGVTRKAETDGEGTFSLHDLPGPEADLHVAGPNDDEWSRYDEKIEVDREVTVVLKRRGVIAGRASDAETGKAVSSFTVQVEGPFVQPSWVRPGLSYSSRDGRFLVKGLTCGFPFNLTVIAGGYGPTRFYGFPKRPDGAEEEVVPLYAIRPLEGVAFDPETQAPLAGVEVAIAWWDGHPLYWGSFDNLPDLQRAVTAEDGTFSFQEGQPGTIFVRAKGRCVKIIGPEDRARYLVAPRRIRIPLPEGESIEGVCLVDGRPSPGQTVYLVDLGAASPRPMLASFRPFLVSFGPEGCKADSEGRLSWKGLHSGSYELKYDQHGVKFFLPVQVGPEEHAKVVLGDDLGTVMFQGRVLAPEGKVLEGMAIRLQPLFPWKYSAVEACSEAGGGFRFKGLQAGRYAVEVKPKNESRAPASPLPAIELSGEIEMDLQVPSTEK